MLDVCNHRNASEYPAVLVLVRNMLVPKVNLVGAGSAFEMERRNARWRGWRARCRRMTGAKDKSCGGGRRSRSVGANMKWTEEALNTSKWHRAPKAEPHRSGTPCTVSPQSILLTIIFSSCLSLSSSSLINNDIRFTVGTKRRAKGLQAADAVSTTIMIIGVVCFSLDFRIFLPIYVP